MTKKNEKKATARCMEEGVLKQIALEGMACDLASLAESLAWFLGERAQDRDSDPANIHAALVSDALAAKAVELRRAVEAVRLGG